ncbi:MAG: hypothetical protein WA766_00355, partial [Candidatus Acidiferrales bacterium]
IDMVKAKPVALESEREKMPFEVTPFMPFLTYYISPGAAAAQTADAPKPSVTTANTDPTRVPAAQPQD